MKKLETCKDVNPLIEKGKLTVKKDSISFSISDLDVNFTLTSILEILIQDGLKKTLSAYTASFAKAGKVPDAIAETIDVWREGKYLTPSEKEKASKAKTTVSGTTGTKKLPYTRLDIEAAMRDVTSLDDPRVKVVEAMDDENFSEFMVLCNDELFVIEALDLLAKRLREKQERETTDKKAQFTAMLAKAKGM